MWYYFLKNQAAFSFPFDNISAGNILPSLTTYGIPKLLTKITVNMFAIVCLLPNIPIMCIVSKNNLIQNQICSKSIIKLKFRNC